MKLISVSLFADVHFQPMFKLMKATKEQKVWHEMKLIKALHGFSKSGIRIQTKKNKYEEGYEEDYWKISYKTPACGIFSSHQINLWIPDSWSQWKGLNKNIPIVNILRAM